MHIRVLPLGAGQDVGRSCVIVQIGGKTIMFDCGMHMGYTDEKRFPDFSFLSKQGPFDTIIDCVLISHFHLDHCGALPYFTEMCGYDGPLIMTHATKAVCPILLEDYRKITADNKGEGNFFTSPMIRACMNKVRGVNIHESVYLGKDFEVRAYYAGHVLGAAMFYVRVGNESVVYTGDYNMTPDRHLGAAWIDHIQPDVLLTESTYATTIRDSKRARERDFLQKVHSCVLQGGKVLIPCFALGRAQELCILLDAYWERMNLSHIPVYFSAGLTQKANHYYRLFIHWTNQKIKSTFMNRNMFEFKHIQAWDRRFTEKEGAMVVFATPGMLHAGTSLELFKKWCSSPKNMVILPGYCVAGTVGAKVLMGQKKIEVEGEASVNPLTSGPLPVGPQLKKVVKQTLDVKLQVENLSFSAHADAKGIMQLVRQSGARSVVLVHGEKPKMSALKKSIQETFAIPCYDPANGQTIFIPTKADIPVYLSRASVKEALHSQLCLAQAQCRDILLQKDTQCELGNIIDNQKESLDVANDDMKDVVKEEGNCQEMKHQQYLDEKINFSDHQHHTHEQPHVCGCFGDDIDFDQVDEDLMEALLKTAQPVDHILMHTNSVIVEKEDSTFDKNGAYFSDIYLKNEDEMKKKGSHALITYQVRKLVEIPSWLANEVSESKRRKQEVTEYKDDSMCVNFEIQNELITGLVDLLEATMNQYLLIKQYPMLQRNRTALTLYSIRIRVESLNGQCVLSLQWREIDDIVATSLLTIIQSSVLCMNM